MSEELNNLETPAWRLIVQGTGEEFPLSEEPLTIGSGADNAVVLADPEVAGQHATIRRNDEGTGYLIEDAGSLSGTYVNEQRVEGNMPLQEGDVIRVGNTLMDLQGGGEPEVAPAAAPPSEPRKVAGVSPWVIGGVIGVTVLVCLACISVFALAFSGGREEAQVTTQPPTAVATQAPGQPTQAPQPSPTNTPLPAVTDIIPLPEVEYFQADPPAIEAGSCTLLQWGQVTGADEVRIEPRIGGVGTPDSVEVCPEETTEYILTATGPGGVTEVRTTVEVIPGMADLMVESITFDPNPANAQEPCAVEIVIRNVGPAAAGGFAWLWQAGSDASFDGRIDGLGAGEATVVSVQWVPQDGYQRLTTEAVLDTANEVPEEDKSNNRLSADVQVLPLVAEPETVEVKSDADLDGFRANNGQGSISEEILVGNGEIVQPAGELVARGFLSFDVTGIPADATIESAELQFYQSEVTGDPYGKLGGLVLDLVSYGSSLDDSAYDAPAMGSLPLSPLPAAGQWYMVSDATLLSWVQNVVTSEQAYFQVRLRFSTETDDDGEEDWIAIQPGGSFLGSSKSPTLIITYTP